MRSSALRAAVIVILATAAFASPVRASYVIERGGRSAEIPSRTLARREVVDLDAAARFLGLTLRRDRKRLSLEGERGTITLQIGRAAIQVNGQPVLLSSEVDADGGRFFVPVDFLTRALPRFLDEEVHHDPAARAVRFDARAGAMSCERFADRLRITIAVGKDVPAPDVTSSGNRRIVVLRGVSLPETAACDLGETLADLQVKAGRDTTITLVTGPGFGGLEVQQVPASRSIVLDVLDLAAEGPEPSAQDGAGLPAPAPEAFDTIAIDPGHGGDDHGARSKDGLDEKSVTLGVARALARKLAATGLRVVLTRSGDETVPLTSRTELANRERADLFISLHANASPSPDAFGAETYFLHAEATDDAARGLAASENDATGLRARGQGGGDLEMLLWDMAQQQYLEESSRLADSVQRELNDLLGTRDRGVKQANFLVLRGATMPAILVEVGFVSNPAEAKRLRTDAFQAQCADALTRAILAFRDARAARSAAP